MNDAYLNMRKLTQHFSLSRHTVLKLIKEGLPAIQLPSGYHLFKVSEVEAWLRQSESQRCTKRNDQAT